MRRIILVTLPISSVVPVFFSGLKMFLSLRQMPPVTDSENVQVMSAHTQTINRAAFLTNIDNLMWGLVIFFVIQLILIIFKYWKTGPKWYLEEKPQWKGVVWEQISAQGMWLFLWHAVQGQFLFDIWRKENQMSRTETLKMEHTMYEYYKQMQTINSPHINADTIYKCKM